MTARPVLFASDLESTSDSALREAYARAARCAAPLIACHVLPELVGIRPLFPQLQTLDRAEAMRIRKWTSTRLQEQIRRVLGGIPSAVSLQIESGSAHATLLLVAEESDAGLVVVPGTSQRRGVEPGDVVDRLARHLNCPLLVWFDAAGRSVLAATDFSDPALPAVALGHDEAGLRRLPFHVVHAVEPLPASLGSLESNPVAHVEAFAKARRDEAEELLALLTRRFEDAHTIVQEGLAVDVILETAESVDAALVVLGTHGRTGIRRLALGSVAEGVLRRTRRSTLVVPLAPGPSPQGRAVVVRGETRVVPGFA